MFASLKRPYPWLWFLLVFASFALFAGIVRCQSDSMIHVKSFPGGDVGTKIANAQATCPNSSYPCILVIDASLAAAAPGTMPALCSNCTMIDYRNGAPGSGANTYVVLNPNDSSGTLNPPTLAAAASAAVSSGGVIGRLLVQDTGRKIAFNFGSSTDLQKVPIECEGYVSGVSAGAQNITLNYTATSGVFLYDVSQLRGCAVTGGFTLNSGKTLHDTITGITVGAHNTATATVSGTTALIPGASFILWGMNSNQGAWNGATSYTLWQQVTYNGTPWTAIATTTAGHQPSAYPLEWVPGYGWNGAYRAATVAGGNTVTFQVGLSNLPAYTNTGTVTDYYYPTVGVMAGNMTGSNSFLGGVDLENVSVAGFGTDYDISADQGPSTVASSNFAHVTGQNYALNALIGMMAKGNGRAVADNPANVAEADIWLRVKAPIGIAGGPCTVNRDAEESAFAQNQIMEDWENGFTFSINDSPIQAGIILSAYGNRVHDSYITAPLQATGGTYLGGVVDSCPTGANSVENTMLTYLNVFSPYTRLVNNHWGGFGLNESHGSNVLGGIATVPMGYTPPPHFTSVPAGSSGATHAYGVAYVGYGGGISIPSTQFICPDGSYVTATTVANSATALCPANIGPTTPASAPQTICFDPVPGAQGILVLEDDLMHMQYSGVVNLAAAGNTCETPVTPGTNFAVPANYSPTVDTSDAMKTSLLNATNIDLTNGLGAVGLKDEGTCTMTSGACASTNLGHTYTVGPYCFVNWDGTGTLTGLLKETVTASTIKPQSSVGTDTAEIRWGCFGK